MESNPSFNLYFGKSQDNWSYPILNHSCDVVAVGSAWLKHSPFLLERFGKNPGNANANKITREQILFFLFLHDIGKISWRFQRYNPELWMKTLGILPEELSRLDVFYDHGFREDSANDGSDILFKELNPFYSTSLNSYSDSAVSEELWNKWSEVSLMHHDRLGLVQTRASYLKFKSKTTQKKFAVMDKIARKEFFEFGKKLFFGPSPSIENIYPTLEPTDCAKGFCSVCDWIASNEEIFGFSKNPEIQDASEYITSMEGKCEKALASCGLIGTRSKVAQGCGFPALFPDFTPRGIQAIPVPEETRNRLFLAEASTGSGKTEFALSLALEMLQKGEAETIIFALPTQATSNSVYDRITNVANTIFPGGANVVLAHGKTVFHENFMKTVGAVHTETGTEENGAVRCVHWLNDSRKRSLLGQICVCTVDQVLKSSLPIRHNFVTSFAIGRSVLIIDEVHSYSAYMNQLLDTALIKHSEAGGSAILLSATLPEVAKKRILRTWGGKKKTVYTFENDYPLITVAEGRKSSEKVYFIKSPEEETKKTVHIESLRLKNCLPDEITYERIINEAKKGKAAAFICNLVDDAMKVYKKLKELGEAVGLPVDFIHSRYLPEDRALLEAKIIGNFGKKRKSGGGRIVVSTQVLEQSLDLDFDVLFTQICPSDLLFQRIGRLYRHPLERVDSELPLCVVLSPEGNDFGGHSFVYGHLWKYETSISLLWRTRHLIENCGGTIEFPAVYRPWVDAVYNSNFPGEDEISKTGHEKYEMAQLSSSASARSIIGLDRSFKDTEEGLSMLTRDGEMSCPVLLVSDNGTKFLDGSPFNEKMLVSPTSVERENIMKNTVYVPSSKGWVGLLPRHVEGYYIVKVKDLKNGNFENKNLIYSKERGIERR